MMLLSSVVILNNSGTFCEKIFITGHMHNLIGRLCITSTFDIPLKNTCKIFVDRSISLKFKRMFANEYRKIFAVTKNSCVKHE